MTIDILCKVVDNFGDIGVVYRLARALSEIDPKLRLRLIVDNLTAFRALDPEVDKDAALQEVHGWTVVGWTAASAAEAAELFRAQRPRFVVECFACGRPAWYEEILFDPEDETDRFIVNLEYLTAEDFALDFHLLPSLTRSAKVRKAVFMPGFAAGTGGLIIDRRFRALKEAYADPGRRAELRRVLLSKIGKAAPPPEIDAADRFWVSVFAYDRDFTRTVRDLALFHRERPILALVADGKSAVPFLAAWEREGQPFPAVALPFLPQELWDEVILASDFAVVRGEESLARAALSGRPFLWEAYRREDSRQLVKVRALLDKMRPYFAPEDFSRVEVLFLAFNLREEGPIGIAALLGETERVKTGFSAFSENLFDLGDLAAKLLTFIREFG